MLVLLYNVGCHFLSSGNKEKWVSIIFKEGGSVPLWGELPLKVACWCVCRCRFGVGFGIRCFADFGACWFRCWQDSVILVRCCGFRSCWLQTSVLAGSVMWVQFVCRSRVFRCCGFRRYSPQLWCRLPRSGGNYLLADTLYHNFWVSIRLTLHKFVVLSTTGFGFSILLVLT